MKIAVLGTGMVGRALAGRLGTLGHDVTVGTRNTAATLARTEPDGLGNPPYPQWAAANPWVRLASFANAAASAELVVSATNGAASIQILESAGRDNLAGKVLIDIANPLDVSQGLPPSLLVSNTDSLGEQIQRAFPQARVVKTLNTMNAYLMADPKQLAGGAFTTFVSGNDADAKDVVTGYWPTSDTPTSSTWVTSPPRAAPRCCCRSGCACGVRWAHQCSTSRSSADRNANARPGWVRCRQDEWPPGSTPTLNGRNDGCKPFIWATSPPVNYSNKADPREGHR
jgi:predicted dinucleotide-binding enzyme